MHKPPQLTEEEILKLQTDLFRKIKLGEGTRNGFIIKNYKDCRTEDLAKICLCSGRTVQEVIQKTIGKRRKNPFDWSKIDTDTFVQDFIKFGPDQLAERMGLTSGAVRTRMFIIRNGRHPETTGKNGIHIHHIDGNPENNDPSNLYKCENIKEHGSVHTSLKFVLYKKLPELLRSGAIKFENGRYQLVEE